MKLSLSWKPYQRPFRVPLQTHHGQWSIREGLWVTLTDEQGRCGHGEIAPIPWFGTETLAAAIAQLQSLPTPLTEAAVFSIPNAFPTTQFGLGSAWDNLLSSASQEGLNQNEIEEPHSLKMCGLLPTGAAALDTWKVLWTNGYRTFKLKIGVESTATELELMKKLLQAFPPEARLRLDANGGLTVETTKIWLEWCKNIPMIEFLEQPLPPEQFPQMQQFSQSFPTPLALDESVTTLQRIETHYQQGWQGIMVIKPAIAGYPQELQRFLQKASPDTVISSAFETRIGRTIIVELAKQFHNMDRAVGFGVSHWFDDDL
jgi:o-succinylbenzoate synthase